MNILRPPVRDCSELLEASQEILRYLTGGGEAERAIRRSLDHLARGVGAHAVSLKLVEHETSSVFRALHAGLPGETCDILSAPETGRGTFPEALATRITHEAIRAARSTSLSEAADCHTPGESDPHLVGIPVFDAVERRVIAVICLRTPCRPCHQVLPPGDEPGWLDSYAASFGHAFAYFFDRARSSRRRAPALADMSHAQRAPELIGESSETEVLRAQLHEVYIPAAEARDPDPVLILGEKGTGKDLVVRYLHGHSQRRQRPLVVVNCAEITDELSASRFFGHRRGAFTGALSDESGFFRAADKGVLFLDEIGELSLRAQATLLRVLENRTVVPVGETREIAIDVQVVLATNRDPEQAVREGVLKPDFLDRFSTQSLHVAPLRQRVRDIPPLVRHFHAHFEERTAKRTPGFTAEALKAMLAYTWPGNVRELSRVCSLLLTHAKPGSSVDHDLLTRCYPPAQRRGNALAPLTWDDASLRSAMRAFQRELLLSRLRQHDWNARAARDSLEVPKTTFQRLLAHAGIKLAEREVSDDASEN
jgi:DNA-binding NtrC family response regulator